MPPGSPRAGVLTPSVRYPVPMPPRSMPSRSTTGIPSSTKIVASFGGSASSRGRPSWRTPGSACRPERLEKAFDDSWAEYERAWFDNRQYLHDEAVADIVRAIGVTPTDDVVTALAETFPGAADGADLHLTDGIEDCLRALRSAGVRIGIVCDVGMTPSPSLIAAARRARPAALLRPLVVLRRGRRLQARPGDLPARTRRPRLARSRPRGARGRPYPHGRGRRARHGHGRGPVHRRVRRRRSPGPPLTTSWRSHADLSPALGLV